MNRYPEFEEETLEDAVRRLLDTSVVDVVALGSGHVEPRAARRSGSISLAAEQRGFSLSVWLDGIQHGGGWASDLPSAVKAARAFFVDDESAAAIATRFPWFTASARAQDAKEDAAAFVESEWKQLRLFRDWSSTSTRNPRSRRMTSDHRRR